jgi:transcriptional regulator with XRE-family HTH domain
VNVHARLLKRAIDILGGWNAFCARVGVSEHRVQAWLNEESKPPERVLLKAAEIVLDDDIAWAAQDRRTEPRTAPLVADPTGQSEL